MADAYLLLPSDFGTVGLVWREAAGPKVWCVVLPGEPDAVEAQIQAASSEARPGSSPVVAQMGEGIRRFLAGEPVAFNLSLLALERCSAFQRQVLLAEYGIPRGWVSTYGRIAHHLARPGAARAVGRALATNPFPLVIPCHRAVRSNGELGGYRGGPEMKRALLELEGVEFSSTGGVVMDRVHY